MNSELEQRGTSLPEVAGGARGDGSWVFRAVPVALTSLALLGGTLVLLAALVPIKRVVEGTGVLEAMTVETVRASEGGVVSNVRFEAGDTVNAGQVLVQLDPVEHDAELLAASLRLESQRLRYQQARQESVLGQQQAANQRAGAEAEAVRARAELRSSLALFQVRIPLDSFLVAFRPGEHVQLDLAVSAVRQAEVGLADAAAAEERSRLLALASARELSATQAIEAEIHELERRRDGVEVVSPIDGVVLGPWTTDDLVGRVLLKGEPIAQIADESGWRVSVEIRPMDVHKIAVGMSADVRIESLPASSRPTFEGIIRRIAPSPASAFGDSRQQGYQVEVGLAPEVVDASEAERLRIGYLVSVRIVTAEEPILTLLWDRFTGSLPR